MGELLKLPQAYFKKIVLEAVRAVHLEAPRRVSTPVTASSQFDNNRAETYGGALALGNTVNAYANLEV